MRASIALLSQSNDGKEFLRYGNTQERRTYKAE